MNVVRLKPHSHLFHAREFFVPNLGQITTARTISGDVERDTETRPQHCARPSKYSLNLFLSELPLRMNCQLNRPPKYSMKRISILGFAFLGIAIIPALQADLSLPEVSQLAVNKQRIGLTDITITYHRPLVNGRKIWGGLVPLGEVWRAGANENTTTEVSSEV